MTVGELIKHLEKYDKTLDVQFIDYYNNGDIHGENMDILEIRFLVDKDKLILG